MKAKEVEIAKEVIGSDGWWRFACGDVWYRQGSVSESQELRIFLWIWTLTKISTLPSIGSYRRGQGQPTCFQHCNECGISFAFIIITIIITIIVIIIKVANNSLVWWPGEVEVTSAPTGARNIPCFANCQKRDVPWTWLRSDWNWH